MRLSKFATLAFFSIASASAAQAQSSSDLAKKLSNPIANLISVPFQYNYNSGYGDGSGEQNYIKERLINGFGFAEMAV